LTGIKNKMINNKVKVYIGSDHAGFELKNALIDFLVGLDYEVSDKGAFGYDEGDDYPDFISSVAREVSEDPENAEGIILGASGQGEAITANRFKNVRAAVYYGGNSDIIRLSRQHNNTNILSLGARFLSEEKAKEAVKIWLNTPFSRDERHIRRIKKIEDLN